MTETFPFGRRQLGTEFRRAPRSRGHAGLARRCPRLGPRHSQSAREARARPRGGGDSGRFYDGVLVHGDEGRRAPLGLLARWAGLSAPSRLYRLCRPPGGGGAASRAESGEILVSGGGKRREPAAFRGRDRAAGLVERSWRILVGHGVEEAPSSRFGPAHLRTPSSSARGRIFPLSWQPPPHRSAKPATTP